MFAEGISGKLYKEENCDIMLRYYPLTYIFYL